MSHDFITVPSADRYRIINARIPIDNPEDVREDETPVTEWVRFRTLGCMPCTGAVKSEATTLEEIVAEAGAATRSERETRVIDHGANTMEDKKREGYF